MSDFVYLKLQPYRRNTAKKYHQHKLLLKFFGPLKVLDKIGNNAYQLELPPIIEFHHVFHVSQLKLCPNPGTSSFVPLSANTSQETSVLKPEAILGRKMVKRGHIATTKVLVKWKDYPMETATWEFYHDLLTLEDKCVLEGRVL